MAKIPNATFARPIRPIDFFPYFVRFDMLVCNVMEESKKVRPHQHTHYEILLIERGPYNCRVNDERVHFDKPGLVFLKPGDWHDDICESSVIYHALWLQILPGPRENWSANIFAEQVPPRSQVLKGDLAPFHQLFARMREELERNDIMSGFMLDSMANEFLWTLLRALPPDILSADLNRKVSKHGFANEIMRLFAAHLAKTLDLERMAAHMKMSKRSFTDACAETFKTSPMKLFVRYKMERARLLLGQTRLTVKQVSQHLGFENQYHFSKVYKRLFGFPPTETENLLE